MPEDLAIEIDDYQDRTGVSLVEFVRRACREKLDRDSGKGTTDQDKIKQAVYEVLKEMGYKDKRGEA